MLNPAHILEVAFLLLAAFLAGATVGSVARVVVLRMRPARASAALESPAARATIVPPEPALIATPTIDPVAKPAVPSAPADVPAPDFKEAVEAIAPAKPDATAAMSEIRMPTLAPLPALDATKAKTRMAPARAAGQTTSGQLVASPMKKHDAPTLDGSDGEGAQVIPFPIERTSSAAEEQILPETSAAQAEPVVAEFLPPADSASVDAKVGVSEAPPVEVAVSVTAPTESTEQVSEMASEPETVRLASLEVQPTVGYSEDDEGAAMRAIEGSWSPRRGASGRSRATSMPEGVDAERALAAVGAAVKAAADAAAAVIADQLVEAPGRPEGIEGPRHGVKDNLTNVIGVLPIIETALNKLGVYHFDQIAEFSDENVAWLEGHLGIAGRVAREHWREQARELAVVSDRARKVAGQQ